MFCLLLEPLSKPERKENKNISSFKTLKPKENVNKNTMLVWESESLVFIFLPEIIQINNCHGGKKTPSLARFV